MSRMTVQDYERLFGPQRGGAAVAEPPPEPSAPQLADMTFFQQLSNKAKEARRFMELVEDVTPDPNRPVFGDVVSRFGRPGAISGLSQFIGPRRLGEAEVGLIRGTANIGNRLAGVGQMALDLGLLHDDTLIKDIVQAGIDVQRAASQAVLAKFPRSKDETLSFRNIVGTTAEAAPEFAAQLALAFGTGGGSLPGQVAVFAGTAAVPVVGQQYLDALDHHIKSGVPENAAKDLAAMEAGTAGLITLATNAGLGGIILRRVPGGDVLIRDAARNVILRTAGRGGAESAQEMVEQVLTDAVAEKIRQDPITRDLAYWENIGLAGIAGAILGSGASVPIEVSARRQAFRQDAEREASLRLARSMLETNTNPETNEPLTDSQRATLDQVIDALSEPAGREDVEGMVVAEVEADPAAMSPEDRDAMAVEIRAALDSGINPDTGAEFTDEQRTRAAEILERIDAIEAAETEEGAEPAAAAETQFIEEVQPDEGEQSALRRFAEAQFEAVRQTRRPAGQAGAFPGARGGSAPVFSDVIRLSAAYTALAIDRGITAVDAAVKFVVEQVRKIIPNADEAEIQKSVTRLMASPPDDFESAAAAMVTEAVEQETKQRGTVKQRIREAAFGPNPKQVSEKAALKGRLRGEQLAAREAERSARRAMNDVMRRKLRILRAELQESARIKANESKEAAREKVRRLEEARASLVDAIQKYLPKPLHGLFLDAVANAKPTHANLARNIRKIREAMAEHQRREAISDLETLLDSFNVRKLRTQFRAAIEAALKPIDRKKLTDPRFDKLEALAFYLATVPDAQVPLAVSAQLAHIGKTAIKDLDAQTAQNLADTIRHILHLNKTFNRLVRNGKLREESQTTNAVAFELKRQLGQIIADQAGTIVPPTAPPTTPGGAESPDEGPRRFRAVDIEDETGEARGAKAASGVWGRLARAVFSRNGYLAPDLLAEWMGGGEDSEVHRVFFEELNEAHSNWLAGHHRGMDQFKAIISAAGLDPASTEFGRYSAHLSKEWSALAALARGDVKLKRRKQTKADIQTIKLPNGETLRWTRAERMHFIASMMDEETFDLVAFQEVPIENERGVAGNTIQLSRDDIKAIIDSASDQEVQIVRDTMRFINRDLKLLIRKWSLDTLGYDITKDGTYFPRHRDHIKDEEGLTLGAYIQKTIRKAPIVQLRTGGQSPLMIRDFVAEVNNLIWVSNALAHMEGAATTARKVLNSKIVADTMDNSRIGRSVKARWKEWLDEINKQAVGGPTLRGMIASAANTIVQNVTIARLGLNPRVAMYQTISLVMANSEIPAVDIAGAVARGSMFDYRIDRRMHAASAKLRHRDEGSSLGLANEGMNTSARIGSIGKKPLTEYFMYPILFFDRMAIRSIWRAAELHVDRTMPQADEATKLAAVKEMAERAVFRTQPAFDLMHMTGIGQEARRNPIVKLLTMHMSQRAQNNQIVIRSALRARRDPSPANVAKQSKNASLVLANSLMYAAIRVLWSWILAGFVWRDEDMDWLTAFLKDTTEATVGNLYFSAPATNLVNMMLFPDAPRFDPELDPIHGLVQDGTRGLTRMATHADTTDPLFWKGVMDIVETLATVGGYPISPVRMALQYLRNTSEQRSKSQAPLVE